MLLIPRSISKTRKPPPPDLAVRLEAFYHHLLLSLVVPEVSEDLFLFWVVLAYPLNVALHETLYVPLGEG